MAANEALRNALAPVTVITGHYGVGKTNLTLNLALDLAREGLDVRVVDLDIVNPYFRSSEYAEMLAAEGIGLVAPVMARSSLDTPSLSPAVDGTLEWARVEPGRIVLVDVGGDDAGATALGRYTSLVEAGPYAMLYVVNALRNLTQDPAEAVRVLREIEEASRLRATAVVNNSHLKLETELSTIESSAAFGRAVADALELPLVAQTAPDWCVGGLESAASAENGYSVRMLVKTPWE